MLSLLQELELFLKAIEQVWNGHVLQRTTLLQAMDQPASIRKEGVLAQRGVWHVPTGPTDGAGLRPLLPNHGVPSIRILMVAHMHHRLLIQQRIRSMKQRC